MPSELLADVALRATIPGTDPVFTYRVPPHVRAFARAGQLVWAPLRRQRVQGIILNLYSWETASDPEDHGLLHHPLPAAFRPDPDAPRDADSPTIRDLFDVADPEAVLTAAQIRLARWLSDYYRTSLYEALSLMLPPGVTQEAEPTYRATPEGIAIELGTLPERERAVLYFLRQRGELAEHELRQTLRGSDAELREIYAALRERGLITRGAALSRPRTRPRMQQLVRLTQPEDQQQETSEQLVRAPKQRAVIDWLRLQAESDNANQTVPVTALYAATGSNLTTLRALEKRGLVELTMREIRRDPLAGDDVPPDTPPPLTLPQEQVWRQISEALDANPEDNNRSRQFLLHGVTGSGKTEVYLRAIGRILRQGRQAVVLVPEIALTAQLVRRFAARFPGRLAVLHSGLSLGERYDEWRRLRSGEAGLAIGSRSAVFAPLPKLGLIIVDEEHETSYKHDGAPRYHARDVARRLASLTGSVLILGSATPSIESFHDTETGTLQLLKLPQRVGLRYDALGFPRSDVLPLPPVKIIDMRHELQEGNRSIFSRALQLALSKTLERHEQAVLFLNRRGAASFVMCRDCGHVVSCPNCSTPLALHYDESSTPRQSVPEGILICHSCNHRELPPQNCPVCWSRRIRSFGVGTQRVVEEVELLFPEARTMRWDRDTVGRKGDHSRLLDRFLRHDADVLVGTQMIAKGLDLPLVSLVGVVAADTGLHLPDFRAAERAFQLLTQVAGRAGRRSAGSQVVIQTYLPDHYALRAAQEHDYASFYDQEIAYRRQTSYPPYSRLVRFVYSSASDQRCQQAAFELAAILTQRASTLDLPDWGLIGPAPAFFHRQRNRYRWHLILRAADPSLLLEGITLPPGWSIDIDPVHLL